MAKDPADALGGAVDVEKELFEGVYSLFKSDTGAGSIYDDVSGRFYEDEAPQGEARPFVVCETVDHKTENGFGGWAIETIGVRFRIIADTRAAVLEAKDSLTTLFDASGVAVVVTGYEVLEFSREQGAPALTYKLDDGWESDIDYVASCQKA